MSYKRSSLRNQKAKLAADYNELLKELSSREMTSVGCYTIGDTIGEGTFGKVKLGTHKLTGHQVAVKKISKQHASMIAREIHHHRQLEHPNIVRIYEIIVTETAIHIFSEYCPNGELFDLLASTGRFSEIRVQRWSHQLTSALQLCHRQGIVHRDLKLENILLDVNDNCKICDFGFARFADNKQLLETFCGSLAYSAPEVIMRQKYTGPETDIWSLGVILYTLLAGELPFDDDSEIMTQRKIVNVDYEMPCYFSPYAQDLIANLLKREPTDRFTMEQIISHPWMQMPNNDENDRSLTSHVMELDCSHPTNRDDVDDDIDDDSSSSSTRHSSRSDLDSIFSNPRFKNDLMEYDDDDLMTEASYVSNPELPGRSSDFMQQPNSRKTGFSNYSDGSKFSPQVRSSLGIMTPDDKARYTSRPPRFSAPTVSNRSTANTAQSISTFRTSLPLSLPSNRESIRPSSISSSSSLDGPMNDTEQRLANALVNAGFDESTVQSMRSTNCGTSNTLWNMLMERQLERHNQSQRVLDLSSSALNSHYQRPIEISDRWVAYSSSLSTKRGCPGSASTTLPVDSACQTNSPTAPLPAATIDRMTQTSSSGILATVPYSNESVGVDAKRMGPTPQIPAPPPKLPSSMTNNSQPYSGFGNTTQNKTTSWSTTLVTSSPSSVSDKSGWFSSVKSWFGASTGKLEPESSVYETPLRSSSVRLQNRNHGQPVTYRDFDFYQGDVQQHGEAMSGIYRSAPTSKHQRQTIRSIEWNQQNNYYNTGTEAHKAQHLVVDHLSPTMAEVLSPCPPAATTTTPTSLSIVTTPSKYINSHPAVSSVLSPPAPPAAIYTNNSKNSNNRLCYQNQYLPRQIQQQQPSPPPTPPDVNPTSTLPSIPVPTNNVRVSSSAIQQPKPTSPSPLSIASSGLTPASSHTPPPFNNEMEKSEAISLPSPSSPPPPSMSSPLPTSFSSPLNDTKFILPPTPPTTDEEEKKDWVKTETPTSSTTKSGTAPTITTDSSLPHLKPYSSKSSPALLSSTPKNAALGPASRRFEFTPRSRLSVYGMNDRASSMASKAIIEEEEEDE